MNKKLKLVDSFLFWNEIDLLKTRLEYLGPYVDYFLISEANIDFAGKPKEFILNDELMQSLPYSEKIIYQKCDINLTSINWLFKKLRYITRKSRFLWKLQDYQRNSLLTAAQDLDNKDIIIFGDLDEFPRISEIRSLINLTVPSLSLPIALEQEFFYYTIHNKSSDLNKWHGTIISTVEYFRKVRPNHLRFLRESLKSLPNAGWHFSYFMSSEKIREKILATADVEKKEVFKAISSEEILLKIKSGSDLYSDQLTFSYNESNHKNIDPDLLMALKKYMPHCT
jgi:beta-1,4-mannosyl-glycoprotein beta-1,4-N-acetylglucosaminyltransferase